LSRQVQKIEESSPKVPAYIVTFSDMVTLLLTFFVMLLTLANVQDPELFNVGRDSFMKSIRGFGLGMLSGKKPKPDFGEYKIKHPVLKPDSQYKGRTLDAKKEHVHRIFKEVQQHMATMPSQIVAQKTDFAVTNISFSSGEATLNEPAKRFLRQFYANLQQDSQSGPLTLYVLGLADDRKKDKEKWMLSAMRAKAAADFINSIQLSVPKWPVYSWGAGPGGDWVSQESAVYEESQILIAVLRTNG